MRLDRSSIEHIDFSVVRRGYDPDEVHQHLGEIADAVEALQVAEPSSQLSNEAAEQVRRIAEVTAEQLRVVLETAEQSAADVYQRAEAEATRITEEARRRATETDESAADVCQQAEAEAARITEEAHQRAVETDEWAEQQAVSLRHAIAAAEALADRMGAGASAIGADLEAITWVLEARPPRPALNPQAMAGYEPRSRLALPETAGPDAGATTAGDRAEGPEPASGGGEEPGDRTEPVTPESQRPRSAASDEEPDPAPGEQEPHGWVEGRGDEESGPPRTRGASSRQTGAASAGTPGQSSPEAPLHDRSWQMRTTAFEMAVGGADRGEVARRLYAEFRPSDDDVALVDSTIEEAFQNLEDIPPDERPRMLRRMFGG